MSPPCVVAMSFTPAMLVVRRVPVPILCIRLVLAAYHLLPAILLLPVVVSVNSIRVSVRDVRTG